MKRNNTIDCNADAMQIRRVLTNRPCLWVFLGFSFLAAGVVSWCLISTAGWEATFGILAIHIIFCLRLFIAPHPRLSSNPFKGEDLLKPAGAGGRMVTEAKAPATSQKGTSFHANTN